MSQFVLGNPTYSSIKTLHERYQSSTEWVLSVHDNISLKNSNVQ